MIQDIFPEILNIEYKPKAIKDDSMVFCFKDGKVLCNAESGDVFPLRKHLCEDGEYIYLT